MKRLATSFVAAALGLAMLACGGGGGALVIALQHRAVAREEPLPEGVSRLVWAVTLDDERGEDENFICQPGREVLSERPVGPVVREAVEAELRVRDLRVAAPGEANVVLHIVLHDLGCRVGRGGIEGRIDAEIGLRLMPGGREAYWTTVTERSRRGPTPSLNKPEMLMRRTLEDVLDRFAQHAATHPDVMIRVQELQERGKLPQ